MPILAPNTIQIAAIQSIEISSKGKWITVPTLDIDGRSLIVRGKWLKIARVHDEEWQETELSDPELYAKKLNQEGSASLRADLFTFTQKLPATEPRYQYPIEWDSVAAVRTTSFKDWWDKLPQESRKNVRRSHKRGVTVRIKEFDDDLVRAISDVNNDAPLRQGIRNFYYRKSHEETKKDYSSFLDRSDFICAYFGSEVIGFVKIVYRGDVAAILNFTSKPSHYDKRPANILIAKAIEICCAKGITHLTYGMFNYGNKRHSSLREFKIRNGFEETLVPRYYLPLTKKGALFMKLRLHRGLLGILPHGVISFAGDTREKWRHIVQLLSRCSLTTERPNRNRQMGRLIPPAGSTPQFKDDHPLQG